MTLYVVAPVSGARGLCACCGCRLQAPYFPEQEGGDWGSIWLTPWHDCGGRCTVCMAHAEDEDAIEALRHWLLLTEVPIADRSEHRTGTASHTIYASYAEPSA